MPKRAWAPIVRRPKTGDPPPQHKVYPYLLRHLTIDQPNQVWCVVLPYIPVQRGFLYLLAIMAWASRKVLAWRLSNTMDADFCVAALEEAITRYGRPGIFNTDQGSQFTSFAFTNALNDVGIRVSMDGRGRWMDNVFIERLWRSLKYEGICLKGYAEGHEARHGIPDWVTFYNHRRPHQALAYQTPMAIWRDGITGALGEGAVDMTLRLDNAGALPTSPQPPQQPKVLVA